MPKPGTSLAPRVTSQPNELPQYFAQLRFCFTQAQIIDDNIKKNWACHYAPARARANWARLPEFDLSYTFEEFVNASLDWTYKTLDFLL